MEGGKAREATEICDVQRQQMLNTMSAWAGLDA